MEKEEKPVYLVLSALPYVNGVKHIGNLLGSLLPADVFTRFLRLQGADVIFICGTDEHGAPIEVAALKEGIPVREYVDKYHAAQKGIYEKWDLSFDYFGRTSDAENHASTQELFKRVYDAGFVSERMMKMPFCLNDKRYLPDRFIEGTCPHCGFDGARGDQCEKCGKVLDAHELKAPHCTICNKKDIEFRDTKHLFFELQKLSEKLEAWVREQKHWPVNARHFALQWIVQGLKERCITRDLEWGVRVPVKGFEDKVFYVWFDAPIGYVSFTKEWAKGKGDEKLWEHYWRNKNCRIINCIGKDNLAFHTIIWPAMLMASEYADLPSQIKSFEFLNLEGKKFSTSRNWGIFTDEALDWFAADYWRYYLMSILPETSDADFNFTEFMQKSNNDLANVFGNLVHRCLTFTHMHYGGVVPAPGELGPSDAEFVRSIKNRVQSVEDLFYEYKWQEALRETIALAHDANKFFNDGEPWKKAKGTEAERKQAATTVFLTINCLRSLSIILSPFIPGSCQKVFDYLREGKVGEAGKEWASSKEQKVEAGRKIAPAEEITPLFVKIDPAQITKVKQLLEERSKGRV